ncbi:MAG TPA: PLP-dependent aminotransferase family protein [Micromonosporaceae bacterium]
MRKTWATSGSDFHLDLDGGRGRTAIERALRAAVQSGRLHAGVRLPSSRTLAIDLGVARNSVVEAYGNLVAEGWLTAVTGSGTRVADRPIEPSPAPDPSAAPADGEPRYSLRAGQPDPSTFPRTAWLAAAKRAVQAAPADAFSYGDPRGRVELRRALADYLSRARGVRADAELIVVCSGFTQALSLLASVLVERCGTTMAIESYGHRSYRDLVERHGLEVRDVRLDQHGAVVGDFGEADAALLTPAHQFPLGMALAASRRTEGIAWARERGGLLIEDDYDGEFRYDRQAVGAMQALAPHHVAYAGSVSKTLAPGVRLGWMVLPPHLLDAVVDAKSLTDRQTGVIDQLTLADFIGSGAYDRHVRRSRLAYRRRRDRLVGLLRDRAPGMHLTGLAAGLHAVLELPRDRDDEEIVANARRRGLALDGIGGYGPRSIGPALVIGYGTPPAHAYTTALARLIAALS